MHRWSALVEIVRSFNERGSPRLAFASVVLFVLLSLGIVGLALIAGAPCCHKAWIYCFDGRKRHSFQRPGREGERRIWEGEIKDGPAD